MSCIHIVSSFRFITLSLLQLHLLRTAVAATRRLLPHHRAAGKATVPRTFLEYAQALIAYLRHVDTLPRLEAPSAEIDVVQPGEVHPTPHGRRGQEDGNEDLRQRPPDLRRAARDREVHTPRPIDELLQVGGRSRPVVLRPRRHEAAVDDDLGLVRGEGAVHEGVVIRGPVR